MGGRRACGPPLSARGPPLTARRCQGGARGRARRSARDARRRADVGAPRACVQAVDSDRLVLIKTIHLRSVGAQVPPLPLAGVPKA